MANRQTTIVHKIRAFVGPNKMMYFNTKGGFSRYITANPINVNEHCVFELMDPLEMSEDMVEAFARDTDMSVEDVKAEIGMFRYDISQKMPVSLASLLAQGHYDSPVYGRSLLGSGLAVTSIAPLVEEYDRTHQHEEEDMPF
jgi:hypothetical protein